MAEKISLQMLRSMLVPLPAAARRYMTAVIAVGLILIALHFGLQAHVQQEVRQLVGQWLLEAGGEAGEIRYRLLRGDITIKDARLSKNGMALHVSRTYLHAPLTTLLSDRLSISHVKLRGMDVELGEELFQGLFQARSPQYVLDAFSIFEMAQRIQVDGFNIRAQGNDPLELIGGRLLLSAEEKSHRIQLQGFMAGGRIEMSGDWQRNNAGTLQLRSAWRWRNLPLAPLFAQQGLQAWLQGVSDGDLSWQGDWKNGSHEVSGRAEVFDPVARGFGDATTPASVIAFSGKANHGRWQADIQCDELSLKDAAAYAPVLNQRRLATGVYSGGIHIESMASAGWKAGIKGEFENVTYRAPELPNWRLGRITLSAAEAMMPARVLRVEKVQVVDSDIAFMLAESGEARDPFSGWRVRIEQVDVQNLRLGLHPADGGTPMRLPVMHGKGRLFEGGALVLELGGQEDAGQWHIKAEASPVRSTLTAAITAKGVPLVQLRPLLPDFDWAGMQGMPELAGHVDADVKLQAGPSQLYVHGPVRAINVSIAQADKQISTDSILLDIKKLSLQKRHIERLQVDGWHYQVALMPMTSLSSEDPVGPANREAKNWRIDRLILNKGALGIGSEDEILMRSIKIRGQGLYAGHDAPVSMQAWLGDGYLSTEGKVDVFAAVPRLALRAKLRHALPFFLGDWFSISGAPRIIRGRLNADFSLESSKSTSGKYQGALYLALYHGQLAGGTFPDDAMLKLTGYGTHAIFERLQTPARWRLKVPIAGDWQSTPLSSAYIGSQLLDATKSQMEKTPSTTNSFSTDVKPLSVAHVRLHGGKGLAGNERLRLRNVIAALGENPKLKVELLPRLGNEPLDKDLIRRVRHVQNLIEKYMRKRGVTASRIFPVWPQEQHRAGESGGILIQVLAP